MKDEEIFIGGYIIRRAGANIFNIENTMDGGSWIVTEARLTNLLDEFWKKLEA